MASAEKLPFETGNSLTRFRWSRFTTTPTFPAALKEIRRVLQPGGRFVTVVDLYQENKPSHQWVDHLKVPVQLLSEAEYRSLFEQCGL